jgi:hypothetical protein
MAIPAMTPLARRHLRLREGESKYDTIQKFKCGVVKRSGQEVQTFGDETMHTLLPVAKMLSTMVLSLSQRLAKPRQGSQAIKAHHSHWTLLVTLHRELWSFSTKELVSSSLAYQVTTTSQQAHSHRADVAREPLRLQVLQLMKITKAHSSTHSLALEIKPNTC